MILEITKGIASGRVTAPTSKSAAHRILICAAMCEGESIIRNLPLCEDILATIDCLCTLGVKITLDGCDARVVGTDLTKAKAGGVLECRESGSTLRFLIPIALLSGNPVSFSGSEKLLSRPLSVYERLFKEKGITFKKGKNTISLCGRLDAGEYFIDGNVSSQFISGLLFALSAINGESKITVNTEIDSRPYVDMTIYALKEFGVSVAADTEHSFFVTGGKHTAKDITIEGDWSGAAFLYALNSIGGSVQIDGLNNNSIQGDTVCVDYFKKLKNGYCEIDINDCPDLGPILFTVAAVNSGAKFTGTKRLKDKESDRIECMKQELNKFGAEFLVEENSVTVIKRPLHSPIDMLFGHNDHRIVMSLAVLCTLYGGKITGCEAVKKSYYTFFEDIKALGIKFYETN